MKLEEKLKNLKTQRENAVTLVHRCDGAIEVVEGLIKEKEENKSGHKKTNS